MENIRFNLNSILRISNGASIEEIGNALQNFTDTYLYLDEQLKLNSITNFSEIPYGLCTLDNVENGFLLYENKTNRLIHVFNKDLMNYLTKEKIEFTEFQGFLYDESNEDKSNEDKTEEIETDKSENVIMYENEVTKENVIMYESIDESQYTESEDESQYTESEDESQYTESEETSEDEELDYETIFRIFLKDSDDYDNIEPICINKKIFNDLEKHNEINLEETLNISFSSFLMLKGYIVKTDLSFYDNDFAEILIYTNKPIQKDIIKQLENDAVLNVNSNDIIFFVYTKRENVYSTKVSLDRLPSNLVELCLRNKKYIQDINDTYEFYYNNSLFKIKNEGYGFFSVFDLDLYFYLSRLHPNYYPNVFEYNELPIAQFYYKK